MLKGEKIQLHGGAWVTGRALALCLQQGARLAEAGEFTRRAFLNGRVDLSRAEAVMAMISARGAQEHKAAVQQMNAPNMRSAMIPNVTLTFCV